MIAPSGEHDEPSKHGAPTAAIDCGTNTIKLLICDADGEALVREARMVRLGEGVDATGRLSPAALRRTFAAIEEYVELVAAHEVGPIRFCATSATRDATNAEEFTTGVLERLGVRPEVLSGEVEAALAFAGAVAHLAVVPTGEILVIDVGGGSTELIVGRVDEKAPTAALSMDIGSVRLHERHLASDPPTTQQVAALVGDVEAALDAALDAGAVDLTGIATVIGVAGTVTTVAAGVLGLAAYDRAAIDQQVLDVEQVQQHVAELVALSVEERRALPWMHPGRADVIGAGALILSRVLARCGVSDLVVSECDILDGIAASLSG